MDRDLPGRAKRHPPGRPRGRRRLPRPTRGAGRAGENAYRLATGGEERVPLHVVARRAAQGEPDAGRVLYDGATVLGRALGGLVNLWDPQAVVVGGGVGGRLNGPGDVRAVAGRLRLPVIGLWKDGSDGVYITSTVRHAPAWITRRFAAEAPGRTRESPVFPRRSS
ncbi:ROK family protein [Streptomyces tendae]|uniref:ROK family protein n=1 Tax=Streptomyces tendae TaxID=1932 RepID=UPI003F4CD67B